MKKLMSCSLFVLELLTAVTAVSEEKMNCHYVFAKGQWNPEDWLMIKSPRWNYLGNWEQMADHIVNRTPPGLGKELQEKLAPETYTSMILKDKSSGSVIISAELEFDYRMAPLIVIAPEYGIDDQNRPEYREHWEIVLFDQGINVWRHYYKDGKPSWHKAAFLNAEFKPKKKYKLDVRLDISAKSKLMTISCDGKTFGYDDDALPLNYHVGITGCEGINRFYSFTISKISPSFNLKE